MSLMEQSSRGSVGDDTIELSDAQIATIREAFSNIDVNKNGHIPTSKLGDVMRSLGHNLTGEQLQELVDLVDTDGSNTIEWEEFLPLMAAKLKEKEEQAFYKNLFRMLDKKNKGYIMCEDLRYILQGMAEEVDLTEDEIEAMIRDVDEDGNGEVSFDEFYTLMTSE